jgi:NAD-dependent deacetylase
MQETKEKIVVFSGAGISADSGLKTFRDHGGLWENYDISEVATPEAWKQNPKLVLDFYNMRRKQLIEAKPNAAHKALAQLEEQYEVVIITQNIDNLHERAGSSSVLHLHGELMKVRSERYPELVYKWQKAELNLGDLCERGEQLRPDVVWFGEAVPAMDEAFSLLMGAKHFLVIGTSLNVYPAASLVNYVPREAKRYLIDPNTPDFKLEEKWHIIQESAKKGVPLLVQKLLK